MRLCLNGVHMFGCAVNRPRHLYIYKACQHLFKMSCRNENMELTLRHEVLRTFRLPPHQTPNRSPAKKAFRVWIGRMRKHAQTLPTSGSESACETPSSQSTCERRFLQASTMPQQAWPAPEPVPQSTEAGHGSISRPTLGLLNIDRPQVRRRVVAAGHGQLSGCCRTQTNLVRLIIWQSAESSSPNYSRSCLR